MKRILCIIVTMILFSSGSVFAGSALTHISEKLDLLTFTWTAAATGAVTSIDSADAVFGKIIMVVTDPGSTAPTDDYDIALTDEDGCDIMGDALLDRDAVTSQQVKALISTTMIERPVAGIITLAVTGNSVASATGKVKVYIERP